MRTFDIAIILFTITVSALKEAEIGHEKKPGSLSSVFEGLGFSPVCVAEALASCELSLKTNILPNSSDLKSDKEVLGKQKSTIVKGSRHRDCHELFTIGDLISGARTVYPYDCCKDKKVTVYCDQTTDGGGWTVIQNRDNLTIREDFYRTWIEYSLGFGNVSGEFWLGLNNIHALVSSTLMEMRVDMEDYDGVKRWAKYGIFYVGDELTKYILRIGKYTGDAGDGMISHSGMKFSTHDQENDSHQTLNVAATYKGAHWYFSGHYSNFNGYQYTSNHQSYADGIGWYHFRGHNYSLKKINLKVRPAFR